MRRFEISLYNTDSGWHWTLYGDRDGKTYILEESFRPLITAYQAFEEAQAEIDNPGRTRALYQQSHWIGLKSLHSAKT